MFQRRHYEAIARTLQEAGADAATVERFVDLFKADNPHFIADRFRKAAGL